MQLLPAVVVVSFGYAVVFAYVPVVVLAVSVQVLVPMLGVVA